MNSYKQPARGKKRKQSAETLTPVEQRIRENEINKQRGAGPNFSVYIYPMSYIQPVKSDYDKARGRFAELTVSYLKSFFFPALGTNIRIKITMRKKIPR